MEETENVANLSRARLHQGDMVCFCCMALCENTLNQKGNNTHLSCTRCSRRPLCASLCEESKWWYRMLSMRLCWQSMMLTEKLPNLSQASLGVGLSWQSITAVRSIISEELFVWWNLSLFLSVLLIGFLTGRYSTYHLLHALYMVWSSVQSSFTKVCNVTNDSRLCLLLRARVAIGIKRIERMPFRQLIQLHNSHAPLLYLEASRQLPGTNKLCRIMKEASLYDLSYINNASDIISRNVEKVLSQNLKYVKQQRLWERVACKLNQRHFDDHTIEMFKFVILVLSLFENNNEDIKTVILYGVPGLPSVSLSDSATYADIRAMIVQRAPNLRDFYFVAHGRIIHIENTVIDWGSGHLVLNVHTTKDLPGGSMPGSSDSERSYRNRNKLSDLQRLLLSDASGDEDLDDSISHGGSDSDSFQDSHGIVRQINNGTERNVIPKGEKSLH